MSYRRRRRRSYRGFAPYVPVAERRAKAARLASQLRKQGRTLCPVEIEGRTIAKTFWGKAWCTNLESYSDYSNRLPRGRTYARNGSVIDLQVTEGRVTALVSGSDMYDVEIGIDTLPPDRWEALRAESAGQIDSLVELLQGRLSKGVMEVVTRRGSGLFPSPREIHLSCSCPDWATMCKHVAAVLYGVGHRLDQDPGLLFALRGVDPAEMIEQAIDQGMAVSQAASSPVLDTDDLSAVFGVDFDLGDDDEEDKEEEDEVDEEGLAPPPPRVVTSRPSAPRSSAPRSSARRSSARRSSAPRSPAPRSPATDAPAAGAPATGAPLKARDFEVLAMLTEYPDSRLSTIAEWLDRSPGVVRAALQRLRKRGLVEFVGAPRTGGYRRLAAGPGRHWSPVDDLGAQDLWVLATVGDQPGVRTAALADWLGLSTSAARHTLTRLRKQGLVKFVGPRRTGGWHRAEGVL